VSREVPSYRKRSDGYAFVQHRSIPTRSHRMVLGRWGSPESKQRYQAFLAQLEGQRTYRTLPPGVWPTVDEAIEQFIDYAEKRYMRSYGLSSEFDCMIHALRTLEEFGELPMSSISPATLVSIRTKSAKYLARSSVNGILSRLKRFFRWACENRLAPPALYHELLCVRGLVEGEDGVREPAPIQPAKRESIFGVLQFLPKTLATMVETQYRCAMRPQDVCQMRVQDIDFNREVWLYYPSRHKTKHRKIVLVKAIPPSAQLLLRPYLQNEPYFFPTGGTCVKYTTGIYRDAIKRAFARAKRAGVELEPFAPNQLRHAIATHATEKLGQRAAQILCGHRAIRTTDRYAAQDVRELIDVARQLEETFSPESLNASA
jgi:integrase